MADERRASVIGTGFLVGGVLLGIGVTLLLLLAPLSTCPKCKGHGLTESLPRSATQETMFRSNILDWEFRSVPCTFCLDRRKVSPLKRLQWNESDAPKPPVYRVQP